MIFDRVLLPGGLVQPISSGLLSANSNAVKSDSEGMLHPALSKKRLMIQLGGTALAAKFADDLAQVIGGTAVSSTARYVGLGAATAFFLIQKGREVTLRPGDALEVKFGRTGPTLPHPRGARQPGCAVVLPKSLGQNAMSDKDACVVVLALTSGKTGVDREERLLLLRSLRYLRYEESKK